MQIDAEKWPYDAVSAANVKQFAQLLVDARVPGWKVTYASRGQYGDSLAGIATPLWNADYRRGPGYPGDGWTAMNDGSPAGWAGYSGQVPALLQYTSTPYDKDAYRGTLDQLKTLVGGGNTMTDLGFGAQDGQFLCARMEALVGLIPVRMGPEGPQGSTPGRSLPMVEAVKRVDVGVAGLVASVAALTAAVQALAAGGTSVDTAAVIAAVHAAGEAESAAVAALHDQVAALHAQLAAAGHALEA
jgi:hypothetical protein